MLFRRAPECGVDLCFGDDMQLMVSGYGLSAAGVIDERLRLVEARLPSHDGQSEIESSEEHARAKFMCLYAVMLSSFLSLGPNHTREYKIASNHL
ncbi:MAG: hypothetical protein LLG20_23900 [Acidobacteriales bacterium]|nr:hypothetical protein [Terriglobales bacterium]